MRQSKLRKKFSSNMLAFSDGFCKAHSDTFSDLSAPDYIDQSSLGKLVLRKKCNSEWYLGIEMTAGKLLNYRIRDRMEEILIGDVYSDFLYTTDPSTIGFVGVNLSRLISVYCRISESAWDRILEYVSVFGEGEMNPYGSLWSESATVSELFRAGNHLGSTHFSSISDKMIEPKPCLRAWISQLNNIYNTIEDAFDR